MQVINVSNEDGKACLNLIKFLVNGRWELSGADAETLTKTKMWVQQLAQQMSDQLKSKPEVPSSGFKVKSMGQTSTKKKK